jgi:hypothetical protein
MGPKFKEILFYISAVSLLLSAALYTTEWPFIPYVYAVASAGVAIVYLTTPYEGKNFRLKRLRFMEIAAAILLPISSFFMFKNKNEWFVCLFISAILQLYSIMVKSRELKKEEK